jgi:uncharacterized membrane protein
MRSPARLALAWAAGAATFLALDAVWLTLASARLYQADLGAMLAPSPRLGPAAAFYLIYLTGLFGFCAVPASRAGGPRSALVRGAAFGLVAYATYDLTNQATLAVWSMRVTILDLAWGSAVSAASAWVATLVLRGPARLREGR